MTIRNRISKHVKIRAGDLVPHELNPRVHNDDQKEALNALYQEIGFARSLLGYTLPDGRIKLIDGHLRQSMDPDMEVDVEVLDVTEEEAKKLLLSIDPLAQLAAFDTDLVEELRESVTTDNETVAAMWANIQKGSDAAQNTINKAKRQLKQKPLEEQHLVIIQCDGEQQQIKLLRRFKKEGLSCKAVSS